MTTPFTYYLKWTSAGKEYYGAKYAVGCHPDMLWKSYFTSSIYVENLRKELGEPDIIEIRKIFLTSKQAFDWEHKVLRRLKVVGKPEWLNQTIGNGVFFSAYKKPKSERARQRIAEANQRKANDPRFIERLKEAFRNSEAYQTVHRKPRSPERKEQSKLILAKVRELVSKRPKPICPHCNKTMDVGNFARYHGSKCKLLVTG
jgi:hypothetical protein